MRVARSPKKWRGLKHRYRFDTDLRYIDISLTFQTRIIFFGFREGLADHLWPADHWLRTPAVECLKSPSHVFVYLTLGALFETVLTFFRCAFKDGFLTLFKAVKVLTIGPDKMLNAVPF